MSLSAITRSLYFTPATVSVAHANSNPVQITIYHPQSTSVKSPYFSAPKETSQQTISIPKSPVETKENGCCNEAKAESKAVEPDSSDQPKSNDETPDEYYIYLIAHQSSLIRHSTHPSSSVVAKIGFSEHVSRRLNQLQTGNPERLVVCGTLGPFTKKQAMSMETRLHRNYESFKTRSKGEWFAFDRDTLWPFVKGLFQPIESKRKLPRSMQTRSQLTKRRKF
jgi:hypothetical protein